jgi:hypothetical protein
MANIYRLITLEYPTALVLFVAPSSKGRDAMKEMKDWADENQWVILSRTNHEDATCQIEELVPVKK